MLRFARRSSGWVATTVLIALVLALTSSARAPAGTSILPPGAIAPTERQRMVARRIGAILEEAHYRRATIDDKMSAEIYERYLEFLDGQRSYFLTSDLAEFEQYRYRFDDMIHTGDSTPATPSSPASSSAIVSACSTRLKLLDTEPDWTLDASFDSTVSTHRG